MAALTAEPAQHVVGAGGTLRALTRLVEERRGEPQELPQKRVARLAKELVASSHEERLAMRGISRARADLLPTGALIVHEVLKALEAPRLELCDWGLREGVLLDAFA